MVRTARSPSPVRSTRVRRGQPSARCWTSGTPRPGRPGRSPTPPVSYAAVRLQDLVTRGIAEVRAAATRSDALVEELTELAGDLRDVDAGRAEMQAMQAEHTAALAAKDAEAAQLRQELESTQQALEETTAAAEADRAEVAALREQLAALTEQLGQARTALEDEQAQRRQMTDERTRPSGKPRGSRGTVTGSASRRPRPTTNSRRPRPSCTRPSSRLVTPPRPVSGPRRASAPPSTTRSAYGSSSAGPAPS